jgi:hypothetical protein
LDKHLEPVAKAPRYEKVLECQTFLERFPSKFRPGCGSEPVKQPKLDEVVGLPRQLYASQTVADTVVDQRRKVNVGGEVLLAGSGQEVFSEAMAREAPDGAGQPP